MRGMCEVLGGGKGRGKLCNYCIILKNKKKKLKGPVNKIPQFLGTISNKVKIVLKQPNKNVDSLS